MSTNWRVTALLGLVCFAAYLVRADVMVAWGWSGALAFWAGVCLVAASLWLTVPADTRE